MEACWSQSSPGRGCALRRFIQVTEIPTGLTIASCTKRLRTHSRHLLARTNMHRVTAALYVNSRNCNDHPVAACRKEVSSSHLIWPQDYVTPAPGRKSPLTIPLAVTKLTATVSQHYVHNTIFHAFFALCT
jgi:hypothetical protein